MGTEGFSFIVVAIVVISVLLLLFGPVVRRIVLWGESERKADGTQVRITIDGVPALAEIDHLTGTISFQDPPRRGQAVSVIYTVPDRVITEVVNPDA